MFSLGLDISTLSIFDQQLQLGIPQPYITESGNNYVAENGTNAYTTEG